MFTICFFFFFKQKTAYEMRISDWSSDVCSSDLLSRCLQFNLKRLDEEQISGQISKILAAEGIAAEPGAVEQLARAADGSLRDGLSLLDQAIAYTGANA